MLFLYISLLSLHNYEGEMPNFTFYGGHVLTSDGKIFSLSLNLKWFLGIQLKKSLLAFDKVNELEQSV